MWGGWCVPKKTKFNYKNTEDFTKVILVYLKGVYGIGHRQLRVGVPTT